jgi:hypothetical protein
MNQVDRFRLSLEHCAKLNRELSRSLARVKSRSINAVWVASLDADDAEKDMVVAFVSRFGRFQDAIADSLIPKWLEANDEKVGTVAENFNKAAKLGIIDDVDEIRAARILRNKLSHEYIDNAEEFAALIKSSITHVEMLIACFARMVDFAKARMDIDVPVDSN